MQRRTALAAASAISASLMVGTVMYAASGGAQILGFGRDELAEHSEAGPVVIKTVRTIDDVVVVLGTRRLTVDEDSTAGASRSVPPAGVVTPIANGPSSVIDDSLGGVAGRDGRGTGSSPATAAPAAISPNVAPVVATQPAVAPPSPSQPTANVPATTPAGPSQPAGTPPLAPAAPVSTQPATTSPTTAPVTSIPVTVTPPSTAPATSGPATTSAPAPPTTVRPAGVPSDWPVDQPIPPMPANCEQPQLEDNGVWNCDH